LLMVLIKTQLNPNFSESFSSRKFLSGRDEGSGFAISTVSLPQPAHFEDGVGNPVKRACFL